MHHGNGPLVCTTALLSLTVGASAYAQRAPYAEDTERLLRNGVQQRQQGRDEDAVVTFDAAVRRCDCGEAFAQRGLARLALGRWLGAYDDLTHALGVADPWVARNRAELEAARDSAGVHRAILQVECGPARGPVRVDGATAGVCTPGSALTLVRALDARTLTLRVELDRTDHPRYQVELRGGEAPVSVFLPPMPSERAPRDPRPYLRVAAVASAVGSIAAASLAITSEVLRARDLLVFDDDNRCLVGSRTREQNCGTYGSAADSWAQTRTITTVSAAMLASGALALGLTSALLPWPPAARVRATMLTNGLALEGSF